MELAEGLVLAFLGPVVVLAVFGLGFLIGGSLPSCYPPTRSGHFWAVSIAVALVIWIEWAYPRGDWPRYILVAGFAVGWWRSWRSPS